MIGDTEATVGVGVGDHDGVGGEPVMRGMEHVAVRQPAVSPQLVERPPSACSASVSASSKPMARKAGAAFRRARRVRDTEQSRARRPAARADKAAHGW